MNNITIAHNVNFIVKISQLPKTQYWVQDIQLPALNIPSIIVEGFPIDVPHQGNKANFDPLSFSFIVDENWENWSELFELLNNSVHPKNEPIRNQNFDIKFDITISVLNSNKKTIMDIEFIDCVPTVLDGVTLDSSVQNVNPLLSGLTCEFSYMQIKRLE